WTLCNFKFRNDYFNCFRVEKSKVKVVCVSVNSSFLDSICCIFLKKDSLQKSSAMQRHFYPKAAIDIAII
ncbi:hypothetical protein KA005_65615, partial [bacterium]|nr:hypothetical protein [bacterium]